MYFFHYKHQAPNLTLPPHHTHRYHLLLSSMAPATKPVVWFQLSRILISFHFFFFKPSCKLQCTPSHFMSFPYHITYSKPSNLPSKLLSSHFSAYRWAPPRTDLEPVLYPNLLCPTDPCLIVAHIPLSMVSPLYPFPLQSLLPVLFKGHILSSLQFSRRWKQR